MCYHMSVHGSARMLSTVPEVNKTTNAIVNSGGSHTAACNQSESLELPAIKAILSL